jgi:multiple sugar transport system substrate-binding protein
MKRLRILGLAVLVLAVSSVAVWAGGGGQKAASGGTIPLRFAYWGGDARVATYNQIAQRYMADNPNVVITLEPSSSNDYWNKLAHPGGRWRRPGCYFHASPVHELLLFQRGLASPG